MDYEGESKDSCAKTGSGKAHADGQSNSKLLLS